MIVKTVYNFKKEDIEKTISSVQYYETTNVCKNFNEDNTVDLILMTYNEECEERRFVIKDIFTFDNIYLMNDKGQTIERLV